ncbi:MAG: hypothetical protein OXU81_09500 [Gammaproteobacteria bacterium]|nr:hypothetical protein [Gammaproteobacteria bacterium]
MVLHALRGLGLLSVAFVCATLLVVPTQAAGMGFLVAGQEWLVHALEP